MFEALVANIAVVALVVSLWVHAQQMLEAHQTRYRSTLFAIAMGFGAAATVVLPVELFPGAPLFDLRLALIAVAAIYTQPLVALVAAAIAASMQVSVDPTLSFWPGLAAIALATAIGVAARLASPDGGSRSKRLALSALIGLAGAVSFVGLQGALFSSGGAVVAVVVFSLTTLTTFASAEVIARGAMLAIERNLLRAAVAQAPDVFFVKDRRGRYVTGNDGMARSVGLGDRFALIGRTDRDLFPPERAAAHEAIDRSLLREGAENHEIEQEVTGEDGIGRWLATSLSALHDADGRVIGIAGVQRDVTERRAREAEAKRDHHLVNFALSEMSDGLAMFDTELVLVLSNPRFAANFPLTGDIRRPGVHLRQILEAVVSTGEQLGIPADDAAREQWVEERIAQMQIESDVEVQQFDGRWLRIRTRPTQDGSTLVVVSDMTAMKQSELALLGMTDQLKELATTDGLTGLLNRRSFDQVLANELARTGRETQPLTLLMIDVDRFKAYNDRYGHPAGDKALRLVADCLRQAALRPGDSLARYGGEEFAAILPNTDEDGAYVIAERLRKSLRARGLPHEGSEKGVITVSVGIASYAGSGVERNESELIRRADQALYDAKAAGRDRVTGWRGTVEVRPREELDRRTGR